jgi:three-Cys-motif partner protein
MASLQLPSKKVCEVSDQSFGGEWTETKLKKVKSYLASYQRALKNQHFITWYVDAFAGTGSRTTPEIVDMSFSLLGDEVAEEEAARYRDGSAKIALQLPRPFNRYLFIEKSRQKCDELESAIIRDFGGLRQRCIIRQDDSNDALCAWCKERDWSRERAVVFLDPFGLQVDWSTVVSLGATKGVDLWYLFPLNLLRLLRLDGVIEPRWRARLDSVFGTREWETRFYERSPSRHSSLRPGTVEANRQADAMVRQVAANARSPLVPRSLAFDHGSARSVRSGQW